MPRSLPSLMYAAGPRAASGRVSVVAFQDVACRRPRSTKRSVIAFDATAEGRQFPSIGTRASHPAESGGCAMGVAWKIQYDRRVSNDFLSLFDVGGPARTLVEHAQFAPFPIDLQFRHNPKTGGEHASLYVGLTTVLNVGIRNG